MTTTPRHRTALIEALAEQARVSPDALADALADAGLEVRDNRLGVLTESHTDLSRRLGVSTGALTFALYTTDVVLILPEAPPGAFTGARLEADPFPSITGSGSADLAAIADWKARQAPPPATVTVTLNGVERTLSAGFIAYPLLRQALQIADASGLAVNGHLLRYPATIRPCHGDRFTTHLCEYRLTGGACPDCDKLREQERADSRSRQRPRIASQIGWVTVSLDGADLRIRAGRWDPGDLRVALGLSRDAGLVRVRNDRDLTLIWRAEVAITGGERFSTDVTVTPRAGGGVSWMAGVRRGDLPNLVCQPDPCGPEPLRSDPIAEPTPGRYGPVSRVANAGAWSHPFTFRGRGSYWRADNAAGDLNGLYPGAQVRFEGPAFEAAGWSAGTVSYIAGGQSTPPQARWVTVTLDGRDYRVPPGGYFGDQLYRLLGVTDGMIVQPDGTFIGDETEVSIEGDEVFATTSYLDPTLREPT